MDDLWARIQAQNEEMDRMNEEKARVIQLGKAEASLAAHEAYVQNPRAHQQQQWEQPQQNQHGGEHQQLSAAAIAAQERELDRQLELERSLARGAAQDQQGGRGGGHSNGGSRGNPGAANAHNAMGMNRPGGKLQHPNSASQKENRAKIPLIPGARGAPPSSCGGPSEAGDRRPRPPPSCAGSIAPSVAGSMAPSLRQRGKPVHFTHNMMRAGDITQMDEFLNPAVGIRGQMKRAGVAPKDHMRENRNIIKEMAELKLQQAQAKEAHEDEKKQKAELLKRNSRMRAQMELHKEGVMDITEGFHMGGGGQGAYAHHHFEDGRVPQAARGASAGRRMVRPPATGQEVPPPPPKPHEPGRVPAYLQRRKAEWQAEAEEQAARAAKEAECPPGTRLVGPEEKTRILEKLAEERAKAEVELRGLPFVVKTQATQLKKDRLEARLEEIAGAEEAYMRDKVFVPADM